MSYVHISLPNRSIPAGYPDRFLIFYIKQHVKAYFNMWKMDEL